MLVHETTFDDELLDKALEDQHSTPSIAAKTAKKANVKLLVLTHISARYKETRTILEQAKKIFPSTIVAEDFLKIEIPISRD